MRNLCPLHRMQARDDISVCSAGHARPFLRIAEHLARLGLSAPAVFGADAAAGLILLEDFGDLLLARLIDAADASAQSQTEAMFDTATDALICLHEAPPPPANQE